MVVSQVSPLSRTPFPHTLVQSLSVVESAPGGQQPSSLAAAVIAPWTHCAEHSLPVRESVVQASPSSQLVGQAPSEPSAIPVSQSSDPLTVPSPHSRVHVLLQPSSFAVLPSSHSSVPSCMPLPQRMRTPPPSPCIVWPESPVPPPSEVGLPASPAVVSPPQPDASRNPHASAQSANERVRIGLPSQVCNERTPIAGELK